MKKDIPAWLMKDYEGAEEELADFLQKVLFDEIVLEKAVNALKGQQKLIANLIFKGFTPQAMADSLGEDVETLTEKVEAVGNQLDINKAKLIGDDSARARIGAEAKARAIARTEQLPDLAERSFIYQAHQAEQEGWYTLLDAEYDTLLEFMMGHLSGMQEGSTRYYDMNFIVRTLLPFLESQGIPAKKLYGVSAAPTKACLIVPAARYGWEIHGNNEKKLTKWLMDLIDLVVDPTVTTAETRDRVGELNITKKSKKYDNEITREGDVYVLPGDKGAKEFVIVFRLPNYVQAEIIQRKLKKVVPGFKVGDFGQFAKEITGMLGSGKE